MSGSTVKIEVITIASDEDNSLSNHDVERENNSSINSNLLAEENEFLNLSPKHIIDDDKVIAHLMEMFPDVHVNDVVTLLESFKDDQSTEENLIQSIGNRLIDASTSEIQDKFRLVTRKRKNRTVDPPGEVISDLSKLTCPTMTSSIPMFHSTKTSTATKMGFKHFVIGKEFENSEMEGQETARKLCNASTSKEEISLCLSDDEFQDKASCSHELISTLLEIEQFKNCTTDSDKIPVTSSVSVSNILPCLSEAKRSALSVEHMWKLKSQLTEQNVTQPLTHSVTTNSLIGTLSAKACDFSKSFETSVTSACSLASPSYVTSTGCLISPSCVTSPRKYKEIRPKVLIIDPVKNVFVNNSATVLPQSSSSCVFPFDIDSSKTVLSNHINSNIISSQVLTNQTRIQPNVFNPKHGLFSFATASSEHGLLNQVNSNAIRPQVIAHQTVVQPNVLNTKHVQTNQTLSLVFSQSAQNSSTVGNSQLTANQNININHSYPSVTKGTETTSLVTNAINNFQTIPDKVTTDNPKNIVISNLYKYPLLLVPSFLKSMHYGNNSALVSLTNSPNILQVRDANPNILTNQEGTNIENASANKNALLNGSIVSPSSVNQQLQSPKPMNSDVMHVNQKKTDSDSLLNSEDKRPVKLVIDNVISLSSNELSHVQMQENQEEAMGENVNNLLCEHSNESENFSIPMFDKPRRNSNSDVTICSKLSPLKPTIEVVSSSNSDLMQSDKTRSNKITPPLKASFDFLNLSDLSKNSKQVFKELLRNTSVSKQESLRNKKKSHMFLNNKKLNANLHSSELSSKVKAVADLGLMTGTNQLPNEVTNTKYICIKCHSPVKFEDLAQCTAGHLFCYKCLVKCLGYDRIRKVIHCLLEGCQAEVLDHSDAVITSKNTCSEVFQDMQKDSSKVNETSTSSKDKSSELIKEVLQIFPHLQTDYVENILSSFESKTSDVMLNDICSYVTENDMTNTPEKLTKQDIKKPYLNVTDMIINNMKFENFNLDTVATQTSGAHFKIKRKPDVECEDSSNAKYPKVDAASFGFEMLPAAFQVKSEPKDENAEFSECKLPATLSVQSLHKNKAENRMPESFHVKTESADCIEDHKNYNNSHANCDTTTGQVSKDLGLPGPSGLCRYKESTYAATVQQEEQKFECQCCFNDVDFDSLVQCYEAHLFCCECLRKYTEESVFGQGKAFLTCMTDGCDATFPLSQLKRALPDDLMQKYEDRVAEESLNLAKLQNFFRCPFCKFGAEMIEEGQIFLCQNPECEKKTCRLCKVDWNDHQGLSCEEVEKKDETKIRVSFEEKMAMAKIRECPSCKTKFTKESGCNKITCRCGKSMCYICREPIMAYTHFCHHSHDPNQTCTRCKLCPLTSNDKEDDKRAIVEIKAKAQLAREEQGFDIKKEIGAPDIQESNHNIKYPFHYFNMNRRYRRHYQRHPGLQVNFDVLPRVKYIQATYTALHRQANKQRAAELQLKSTFGQMKVPEKQPETPLTTPRELHAIFMKPPIVQTQQQTPPTAHTQVLDTSSIRDTLVNLHAPSASHTKTKESVYTNAQHQEKATAHQHLNISSIAHNWFQTLRSASQLLKGSPKAIDKSKGLDLTVRELAVAHSKLVQSTTAALAEHENRNPRKGIQILQSSEKLSQTHKFHMYSGPQYSQSCGQKTVVQEQPTLTTKAEPNKIEKEIRNKQFGICCSLNSCAADIIHMLENSAAEAHINISANVCTNEEFQATQNQALHIIKIAQNNAQSKITVAVESAVSQVKEVCEKIIKENLPNLTETHHNQLTKAHLDALDVVYDAGKIARAGLKNALRDVVNIFMKSKFHRKESD